MVAGLVLATGCTTDPGGANLARLRADAEALTGALEAPIISSLGQFGWPLIMLFEAEDPIGADLTIPASLVGLTLEYEPSVGAYQPGAAGGAPPDGVRARLYRVLPNLLPVLPLEDIGALDMVPGGGLELRLAVTATDGTDVDMRATQSPRGNHIHGMMTLAGVTYDLASTLPTVPTNEHGAQVTWSGGAKRLALRWSFPGPAEVVTVGWDFSGPDGAVSVEGEYTVRGPDLVISVNGLPTARYTFESSHRPAIASLLNRPLTADEEALVGALEPLYTAVSTLVYALAGAVRW